MEARFKVLMFPWLAHGHIFPFLELSKNLSKKNFQIYFCSTANNLDSIKQTLNKQNSSSSSSANDFSIELLELHLPSLPDLPPHYHTTKNIPPHLLPTLIKAFQMSRSNFTDIITNLKPDLLIYDGFQPWSAKIASSQNIPAVFFAINGSSNLSFFQHVKDHKSFDSFPYPSIYLTDREKREISSLGQSMKVEDGYDEGFDFGVFQLSHEIVLVRTYKGFEGKYIDYLSSLWSRKIVPVGPLITHAENQENDQEIMDWLSEKPRSSTLYIAFGTENYLSKHQIGELAKGLEIMSNVNFIWAARLPPVEISEVSTIEEALPLGFLERVKTRGLVLTGWVPQPAILAHSSVGGFMSHCGWNSVTEAVYYGVPIIAVPMKCEQPVNCRVVVEAGVCVEVPRDEDGRFDGEGVAEAISKVMLKESGEGFRERARELSEKMKMEEREAICEVPEELSRICMKKL